MDEMKIRGYVTPEDFKGSDGEKIQQALDCAKEKDICKVIIEGEYKVEKTLFVPALMHLYFKNAKVEATGDFTLFKNTAFNLKPGYSFEENLFCLNGENSVIAGEVQFYNAQRITIEDLTFTKDLTFEFSREVRIERVKTENAQIKLLRGCNNFIMQDIDGKAEKNCAVMDTSKSLGEYVIGKDAEIHDVIFRRSKFDCNGAALAIDATEEEGVFNMQIDEFTTTGTAVAISENAGKLDEQRYFNLTAIDFKSGKKAVLVYSDTKHCYLQED